MIQNLKIIADRKNLHCLLIHQIGCRQLRVDRNLNYYGIDLLVLNDDSSFWRFRRKPKTLGSYYKTTFGKTSVRLWTRVSTGLDDGPVYSVNPSDSEIRTLAPELMLAILPLSPDFLFLKETYAKLAEVLFFAEMTNEQLMEFDSYLY